MQLDNIKWDNSHIYKDLQDGKIADDLARLESDIQNLEKLTTPFSEFVIAQKFDLSKEQLHAAAKAVKVGMDISVDIWTLTSYANFELATNAKNEKAKELSSKSQMLSSKLKQASQSIEIVVNQIPQELFQKFISFDEAKDMMFLYEHSRKMAKYTRSLEEEKLITKLSTDGLHAWGNLYRTLSGALKVQVEDNEIGLAEASSLLKGSDRKKREQAFNGIEQAWETQQESVAAILNSINGWRNEVTSLRSENGPLHYLDNACHQSRIEKETLNSLMESTYKRKSIGQKAIKLMAKTLNVEKCSPWDLLAPFPSKVEQEKVPFPKAIEIISTAFSTHDPKMGEFAKMMAEKRWIDSEKSENRASGAFCGGFRRVNEPRVFMTYDGSMGDIITLAHELGHAYHNWVMRDLPIGQTMYSMTLAETASIFAENLVRHHLLEIAENDEQKKMILWEELIEASSLLINIPSRYEFEKSFVEGRKKGFVSSKQCKELMNQAWGKWYEDSLTEYAPMFWASKLHFSITYVSFYNYPYLFGYLFSLGILAQKDSLGENFPNVYENILRDTGQMTAEDLIQKHFGEDIKAEAFWLKSLDIVENAVNKYEALMN